MGRHTVSVSIPFCYGHRIRGHAGKCGHLHGHNARAVIECEGPLDKLGMVVDFTLIKERVGGWIDQQWDHQMLLEGDDPLAETLTELGEPVFPLTGPPTAEVMARHLYQIAQNEGLPVVAVHLWESDTSSATYRE